MHPRTPNCDRFRIFAGAFCWISPPHRGVSWHLRDQGEMLGQKARRENPKMVELELVGIHDDGEHLVFKDATNQRYQLAITEALRAAVRRDRPQLEQLRSATIRPRDIQALIRAGASAQEVAEQANVSVEQVRRYEGPVLAEREFAAERARSLRIGRGQDAPTLGDLVVDRLAARNVTDITWDAFRPENAPWHVTARYQPGQQEFLASWEVNLTSGTFDALDDRSEEHTSELQSRGHLVCRPLLDKKKFALPMTASSGGASCSPLAWSSTRTG